MKKAVQQIMLGTVTKNEKQTAETLRRIRAAGYDGIELNGFMAVSYTHLTLPTNREDAHEGGRNAGWKRRKL